MKVVIIVIAWMLFSLAAIVYADECTWHDHYKVNYRVRHKHCYDSLAEHYKEEPLRVQHIHLPEEADQLAPPKEKEKPVEKIELHKIEIEIKVVPWVENQDDYEKHEYGRSDI